MMKINFVGSPYSTDLQTRKSETEISIELIDEQLSALKKLEESEETREKLLEEKHSYEDIIEKLDFLLSAGYEDLSSDDLILLASDDILSYRRDIRGFEMIPAEERTQLETEYISFMRESIELIKKLPQTLDFAAYIDVRKKDIEYQKKFQAEYIRNNGSDNPEDEYYSFDMRIENQELYTGMMEEFYRMDPSGGTDGKYNFRETQGILSMIGLWKDDLKNGYTRDYYYGSGELKPLTNARRKWLEDSIDIMNYQLLNQSYPSGNEATIAATSKYFTFTVGKFMLAILLIMIAGATISQEIATGSIKSLIIAPVRRWKIFIAKWMTLLTIFFLGLMMLSVLSDIVIIAINGSGSMVDYAYIGSDGVRSIPFFIYNILSLIVGNADILFVMVFALMLSSLLRNTALSVALSVGIYATEGLFNTIITQFGMHRYVWMDFVPFANFDLASDLFPFKLYTVPPDSVGELFMATQLVERPGLLFSSIYLLVLVSCFLLIAMDSFTRRDIK
jgi:ABC-type transport system involved in multi-copper enzyme maturation permease subunit